MAIKVSWFAQFHSLQRPCIHLFIEHIQCFGHFAASEIKWGRERTGPSPRETSSLASQNPSMSQQNGTWSLLAFHHEGPPWTVCYTCPVQSLRKLCTLNLLLLVAFLLMDSHYPCSSVLLFSFIIVFCMFHITWHNHSCLYSLNMQQFINQVYCWWIFVSCNYSTFSPTLGIVTLNFFCQNGRLERYIIVFLIRISFITNEVSIFHNFIAHLGFRFAICPILLLFIFIFCNIHDIFWILILCK